MQARQTIPLSRLTRHKLQFLSRNVAANNLDSGIHLVCIFFSKKWSKNGLDKLVLDNNMISCIQKIFFLHQCSDTVLLHPGQEDLHCHSKKAFSFFLISVWISSLSKRKSKAFLKPTELQASPVVSRSEAPRCGHHTEHNFFHAVATDVCGNNHMGKWSVRPLIGCLHLQNLICFHSHGNHIFMDYLNYFFNQCLCVFSGGILPYFVIHLIRQSNWILLENCVIHNVLDTATQGQLRLGFINPT